MNSILENRTWRYATKKFDSSKKITDSDFEQLMQSVQLTASSYGLQPYHIFIITKKKIREQLKLVSWEQSQITDASHLVVFANQINFDSKLIDDYLTNVSETRNIPLKNLKEYSDFMKSKLLDLPEIAKNIWSAKQTYIALGNLIQAAAELKIDTCPIEGFETEKYNKILNLNKKGLTATVVLPMGYRSKDDQTQFYPKVRKSKEELFTYI